MHFTGVSHDDWIGRVIDGRYRVRALVGTGGTGAVYRIEHVRLGKLAAMKVLHRSLARDLAATRRFRREVEVLSRLDHPNVVQTFDCGHADGQLYLVMEYVRGEDLADVLWREGPLPVARALTLAEQICAALEEAHERGVVHCDLKPDNVMCTWRGGVEQAKVLDFGLARLRGRPDDATVVGGTPGYLSPEQIRGEPLDARSDLYSLGATLYRMLTGERPFEAPAAMEVMRRQLTLSLPPPSTRVPAAGLPAAVDEVIARAMSLRREDRHRSATELRRELRVALALVAGPVRLVSPVTETTSESQLRREDFVVFERQLRRRRRLAAAVIAPLAATALVMVGGVALALVGSGSIGGEREPNDLPALATPLRGQSVVGHIGPGHPDGRPDFDYYRLPPSAAPRTVTAHLTGVPEVDLVLELYDERGRLLARANQAPAGGDEHLGPVAVAPGEAFLRARPVWTSGEPPPGPGTAPYALTVAWGPRAPADRPARSAGR